MNFNEYQERALRLATYPMRGTNMIYPAMGLSGEAGETLDKIKKHWRNYSNAHKDDPNASRDGMAAYSLTEEQVNDIVKELGDVLWYISAEAAELGKTLEEIAEQNIYKLEGRHSRGTLCGEGDNR